MMKVRIEQIKHEHFVDAEVSKNSWKNIEVCKSHDDALRVVEKLRAEHSVTLVVA